MLTAQPDQLPLPEPERGLLAARVTCRECGRPLRDPEARARGVGRGCEHRTAPTRRYDVDQDALPGL